jgi:hypothetical protein
MSDTPSSNRDPRAKKARDNARQRKIAANSSDKAARRHARTIKAGANRSIRRADKQVLAQAEDGFEDSADQINAAHKSKPQHWGTDNAAKRRAAHADAQKTYREAGGRKAVQRRQWEDMRDRIDNEDVLRLINKTLEDLKK